MNEYLPQIWSKYLKIKGQFARSKRGWENSIKVCCDDVNVFQLVRICIPYQHFVSTVMDFGSHKRQKIFL